MHLHAISSLGTPPRIIIRVFLHYFAQLFHMRLRYNYATLVSFSLPYYSIYSFSFLSCIAFSGLNTTKYYPKCGSVMHLSYSRGFYSSYILKLESCFVFQLAEVSAPNGSFSKIKSEPSQLSRVSERFVLSHWVIGQYTGLDVSFLSCLLVPEPCTSLSLFKVRY